VNIHKRAPIKPLSISILFLVLFIFPFLLIMYSFQGYAFGQLFDTQEAEHHIALYGPLFDGDGAAPENIRCWAWADSLTGDGNGFWIELLMNNLAFFKTRFVGILWVTVFRSSSVKDMNSLAQQLDTIHWRKCHQCFTNSDWKCDKTPALPTKVSPSSSPTCVF
jgi:hypothetical protein